MLTTRTPEQCISQLFVLTALVLSLGYGSGLLSYSVPTLLLVSSIFVLGMPHGALDIYFAKHHMGLQHWASWGRFLTAYSVLALCIFFYWQSWPSLSLVTFLLISAYHFADDLATNTPWPLKLLHGLLVVTVPALLHADTLSQLYALVSHSRQVATIILVSQQLAILALAAAVLLIIIIWLRQPSRIALGTLLEFGGSVGLLFFTPPLLAFTLYFCLLHSPRHLLRAAAFLRDSPRLYYRWPVILACLSVGLIAAGMLVPSSAFSFDQQLIAIIFPLLAALTYPHVLLLQWAQFSRQFSPKPLTPC